MDDGAYFATIATGFPLRHGPFASRMQNVGQSGTGAAGGWYRWHAFFVALAHGGASLRTSTQAKPRLPNACCITPEKITGSVMSTTAIPRWILIRRVCRAAVAGCATGARCRFSVTGTGDGGRGRYAASVYWRLYWRLEPAAWHHPGSAGTIRCRTAARQCTAGANVWLYWQLARALSSGRAQFSMQFEQYAEVPAQIAAQLIG